MRIDDISLIMKWLQPNLKTLQGGMRADFCSLLWGGLLRAFLPHLPLHIITSLFPREVSGPPVAVNFDGQLDWIENSA